MTSDEGEELLPGLTWRSLLAVIVAELTFVPVSIYASLIIGVGLATPAVFCITLLFVELGRLYGGLTKQEVLIVYYGAGLTGLTVALGFLYSGATISYSVIYRSFFTHSPFAWSSTIDGTPLALLVPEWLAPPFGSSVYQTRSLAQPLFLLPMALYFVMCLLQTSSELSLAMLVSKVYIEVEEYPFPYAQVDLSMVDFLAERPTKTIEILIPFMGFGILWGVLTYVSPAILGIQVIPVPWYDLTWAIQDYLPGGAFAISTILSNFVLGFIIPFNASLIAMVASFVIQVILNSLFVTTFPSVFPEWSQEYIKGMGYLAVNSRTAIRVWFCPYIGFALAVGILMIIKARGGIAFLLKSFLARRKETITSVLGFPEVWKLLLIYISSTGGSVALFSFLVPEVPIWIPLVCSVVLGFLLAVSLSAFQGEVGYVPPGTSGLGGSAWTSLLYLSNYQGYAGFVFPPILAGSAAPGLSQQFKVALAAKTKPMDLVKLFIITFLIASLVSSVVTAFLWSIAPIPSSAYPISIYSFLQQALNESLIVTRSISTTAETILGPALLALLVCGIGETLLKFGIMWSSLGFFMGLYTPIPLTTAMFIGSAIGKFVAPRFVGKDRWNEVRGAAVAGEALGEGIVIFLAVALAFLAKSSWLWPW